MKLEEKRRQIEQEKRKMEAALSRQQQKVGKAAFLQAINKVSGYYFGELDPFLLVSHLFSSNKMKSVYVLPLFSFSSFLCTKKEH